MFVARKMLGYANALEALKILEHHINVATMDSTQLHEALFAIAPDFEDMLQYHAAQASGCSHIVTRNERHFPQDGIIVLSPTDFMQLSLE
jgi:predicted nucleic acid-binding protein